MPDINPMISGVKGMRKHNYFGAVLVMVAGLLGGCALSPQNITVAPQVEVPAGAVASVALSLSPVMMNV